VAELGVWTGPTAVCSLAAGNEPCGEIWPNGAFLRQDATGRYVEESPFISIPHATWYVFTTITTVGYGDMVATTFAGKVISVIMMVVGLVVIALPITVIGGSFARQVSQVHEKKFHEQQRKLRAYLRWLRKEVKELPSHSYEYCKIQTKIRSVERKISAKFVMGQKIVEEEKRDSTLHPDLIGSSSRYEAKVCGPGPAHGHIASMSAVDMRRIEELETNLLMTTKAIGNLATSIQRLQERLCPEETTANPVSLDVGVPLDEASLTQRDSASRILV